MKKTIIAVTAAALVSSLAVSSADAATYRVQSGDSLSVIAYKYDTSVSNLKNWNDLTSDMIYVNQVLEVSAPATSSAKTYTVQSGDYLSKIGQKFDVYVAELKKWNNLTSDVIHPGQVLKVSGTTSPAQPAPTTGTYTVQSGDTLSHIAVKYDTTVSRIKSWNGLTSNTIYVGQKLKVGSSQTEAPSSNVVDIAEQYIGSPYAWGGTSPSGFDCSGFIYYVFNQAGTSISRTNTAGYYSRSTATSNPKPGDLVFFKNTYKAGISHMGIYAGNGEFIHASDSGVVVTKLSNSYWSPRFAGYRTF
ncbi:LysM peptidoglycan-binding domain-containing protein [Bacillus haikouensis]|uniref:C40 family peptidase n=1 Tax=Bacillus haikouensis TaxID=1510468 RepID=UPI001554A026|nr:LysM peptidoglycan-binding domain-containing protein [Bacillus haikouensis]NQD65605.1 LysM peptidoglycan-binding domain-containing protein [Bacillus haikouensis]